MRTQGIIEPSGDRGIVSAGTEHIFALALRGTTSDGAAEETLDAVIGWGRYGEVFSYNDKAENFSLADVEP